MNTVQPVFVIGSARSGTTMIDKLLTSAESFHEYRAETLLMSVCRKKYGDIFSNKDKQNIFLEDWFRSRQFARSNLTKTEFKALVDTCSSYAELLVVFLEAMAEKNGKGYIVDSTPANLEHAEEIAAQCLYAKFIWVIRDGRDVSLSQEKLGWVNPPTPFTSKEDRLNYLLINWKLTNKKNLKNLGNNLFILKYEEFLAKPETLISNLADFLDAKDQNFDLDRTLNAGHSNSAFGKLGNSKNKSARNRWLAMDKNQLANFTYGCTDELSQFGYKKNSPTISFKSIIRYYYFLMHIKLKKILLKVHLFSRFTTNMLEDDPSFREKK